MKIYLLLMMLTGIMSTSCKIADERHMTSSRGSQQAAVSEDGNSAELVVLEDIRGKLTQEIAYTNEMISRSKALLICLQTTNGGLQLAGTSFFFGKKKDKNKDNDNQIELQGCAADGNVEAMIKESNDYSENSQLQGAATAVASANRSGAYSMIQQDISNKEARLVELKAELAKVEADLEDVPK